MKLLVIAASHRPDSYNKKLAAIAAAQAQALGAAIHMPEYAALDMPMYNDHLASSGQLPPQASLLADMSADCAGIIFSSPEYNWSLPGSLKNIIDWTSRAAPSALRGKTALLLCASTSPRGGIVGLGHLQSALESQQMFVFNRAMPLGRAQTAFTPEGTLTDPKLTGQLQEIVTGYLTYTRKLTNA